ncbi:MAG: hypothetical protein K9M75_01550, partial [Phycisphaerae bacterium]|nr:hypothetical protein [Phycisphaerae bacterium]
MLTKAEKKTAYVIILLILFALSSIASAKNESGSRSTGEKANQASSKASSSSARTSSPAPKPAPKAAPRSVPTQVSRPAPQIASRPAIKQVSRPAPQIASRPAIKQVSRPAPQIASKPAIQQVSRPAPQNTSRPAIQQDRKPASIVSDSVSVSVSHSNKTVGRSPSKSPVTSLRSGNVIQKTTGHSSKPKSAEITTFSQRTFNKTESSGTSISTVSPGSRSMLSVNKIPVKTKYSSVRLPSVRTESKYVKVIEKKPSDRNDHKRIAPSDLKSGKLSKDSNASSRIGNLSRKPLSKGSHENVRESVDRVVLEKKSISINDSKNVNIKGNNNIYVEGNYYEAKDYKPAKNYKDYRVYSRLNYSTGHIHYLSSHQWCNCGKFHLLRWSNTSCSRVVYFNRGFSLGVSYIYPNYHSKYLFVSIGGYWPDEYRYRRYYKYGCHPNTWYGSRPIEYPSVDNSVTNNYYYAANTQPAAQGYYDNSAGTYGGVYPSSYAGSYDTTIDTSAGSSDNVYDDFSDVRDRLAAEQARQVEEAIEDAPAEESLADIYFDNAVEAFAGGDYQSAIDAVNKAIALAP